MFKLEKFYPASFNPEQHWDDTYAAVHIAGTNSGEFAKQDFWPILQKYLAKGKKYLDAGCGIGGWIIFLTEAGYDVSGIDLRARTVRTLTEYNRDLNVKVAGVTRIPYSDAAFDGLLAIGTLEYVDGQVPAALAEIKRVLQPGGIFFIEVPLANALRRLFYIPLKKVERIIKVAQGKAPTFSNYLFEPDELRQLLVAAGFKVIEMQPHDLPDPDSHYGLYIDWKILRGAQPYKLNALGRFLKTFFNNISPWIASTGMVIVARKK